MAIVDRYALPAKLFSDASVVLVSTWLGRADEAGLQAFVREWSGFRIATWCDAELQRRARLEGEG